MKITEEQLNILDSFTCERLTSNESNQMLIGAFENSRGVSLVNSLKQNAWEEDLDNHKAYYVIKNESNDILLFFTLKCGSMYVPIADEELSSKYQKLDTVASLLNAYLTENSEAAQYVDDLIDRKRSIKDVLERLALEKEFEDNSNVSRVSTTHPAAELVHFCVNEKTRALWKSYGFNHPMGEVLFWKFIAPKFFEIQKVIGCQYAYLFAADESEDGTLENYYEVSLKFIKPEHFGTNKPIYDFLCIFMCQEISDMRVNQKYYFDNFNPDEDIPVV